MERGEHLVASAVLVALYLRGAPFPRCVCRKRWGLVRDALLSDTPDLNLAGSVLLKHGLWDEAAVVSTPGALDWALERVERQEALTVLSPSYPARWVQVLGAGAPPALWSLGTPSLAPPVSVVGSRNLESTDRQFAHRLGSWIIGSGHSFVSGGAIGADTQAASGALATGAEGRLTLVLPFGLNHATPDERVCQLSVCPPSAPFTAGQAMERNTLIYAFSPLAIVVRSAFKTGGTWIGATDALRRRLTTVAVRGVSGDLASETLCRLGAIRIRLKKDVLAAIAESGSARDYGDQLFAAHG